MPLPLSPFLPPCRASVLVLILVLILVLNLLHLALGFDLQLTSALCGCVSGAKSLANILTQDLLQDICAFLPPRRTGEALAEGEAIAQRSPAVRHFQLVSLERFLHRSVAKRLCAWIQVTALLAELRDGAE